MSMMRHRFSVAGVIVLLSAAVFQACVDSKTSRLEEIRFLLDRGKTQEALALATQAIADDPTNVQAQTLYAEANLTAGALSGGNGCQAQDVGFLGLLACLQDGKGSGENEFDTFRRIAPGTSAKVTQVETSTDTLTEITAANPSASSDTYLLLYFSKLFEISGVITKLGSASVSNPACTISPSSLTTAEQDRFNNNLATVNDDGVKAGFPTDFELFSRVDKVRSDIAAAADLPTFLNDEICN